MPALADTSVAGWEVPAAAVTAIWLRGSDQTKTKTKIRTIRIRTIWTKTKDQDDQD